MFRTTVPTKQVRTSCKDEDFVAVKEELSEFKKGLSDFYRAVRELVPEDRAEDLQKYLQTKEIVASLVRVVALFDEKYSKLKQKEGVLTF